MLCNCGCSFSLLANNTLAVFPLCPTFAFKSNRETCNRYIWFFVISIFVVIIAHSHPLNYLSSPAHTEVLRLILSNSSFSSVCQQVLDKSTSQSSEWQASSSCLPSFLSPLTPPASHRHPPSLTLWDLPPQSHKSTEDRCLLCLIKALPPGVIPQFEQEEKPSEGVWLWDGEVRGGWGGILDQSHIIHSHLDLSKETQPAPQTPPTALPFLFVFIFISLPLSHSIILPPSLCLPPPFAPQTTVLPPRSLVQLSASVLACWLGSTWQPLRTPLVYQQQVEDD